MKVLRISALAAAGVLTGAMQAHAADAVSLRLATVGIGSAWYTYGAGIADLVKPKLPAGSSVDVLPIAGGKGNIKLIQSGEAELGISFPMPAAEGCGGFGEFKTKHDKVRGLIGGLDTYYFAALVTKKSGATAWRDIVSAKNGFRLLTTKVGGTGETGVRQVLALMDSSKMAVGKKGGSVKAMSRKATAGAISDGKADGWAHVVTRGHPVATQLTTTNDMQILPLPQNVVDGMVKKHGWVAATIPPNTFKGQTGAVKTVKAASNIMIGAGVSNEVAYTVTKTIVENVQKLRKVHAGLANFDPKAAASAGLVGNCAFHPGAAKYYKEAGLMK